MISTTQSSVHGTRQGAVPGATRSLACSRPCTLRLTHGRASTLVQSNSGKGPAILATANRVLDSAAALVPASVPRPAAKLAVGLAGGLFVWGMLQQLLSGFVTLLVVGGLGYYFLIRGGGNPLDGGNNGSSAPSRDDYDDPLSEARKIMDKYKK